MNCQKWFDYVEPNDLNPSSHLSSTQTETTLLVSKFLQLNGCLLFFWRWQWAFLQACMLQSTVALITERPQPSSSSSSSAASLSLSLRVRPRAREGGRASLWTVYFNLPSCRGQRTVVGCMPWQLLLNKPLVWCHDRIRVKHASNAFVIELIIIGSIMINTFI